MKDLNIQSKLVNFSILDDECVLENNADKYAFKIWLKTPHDFNCYAQALYDILTSLIGERKMLEFAYLLNVLNENIYVSKTEIDPDSCTAGCRKVTGFINTLGNDEWDPVKYVKEWNQKIIDRLVSVDFDPSNQTIDGYFIIPYMGEQKLNTYNVVYGILGILVHHANNIILEYDLGVYRDYKEYEKYKYQFFELLRLEMSD